MNSNSQEPTTSKTSGKMRLQSKNDSPKSSNSTPSAKPKTTRKVRFDPEIPSTSTASEQPRSVVRRTKKNIKTYNRSREFDIYIRLLIKDSNAMRKSSIQISSDAIDVLNTFCLDIMDRISKEASDLVKYNKTSTIGMREIKSATKLVLPQELANYAIADANKALKKYTDSMNEDLEEDPMCHCTC